VSQEPRLWLEVTVPDLDLGVGNSFDSLLYRDMVKVMEDERDIIQRMFNRVTNPWSEEHRPSWRKHTIKRKGQDLVFLLYTESTPFVWVTLGHSGGRVILSKDFRPRTRRRVLGSRAKKGRVIKRGIGRKRTVEAREFDLEIADRRNRPEKFPKKMQAALNKGVKRVLRSYGLKVTRIEL